jgi:hypothetical protein
MFGLSPAMMGGKSIPPFEYISGAQVNATSATLGAHDTGDLLIAVAFRNGSSSPPTAPAGWTTIQTAGSSDGSIRVAYKFAASSSEVSGVWTNASRISILAFRGVSAIGSSNSYTLASDTADGQFPAISISGPSHVFAASAVSVITPFPSGLTPVSNGLGAFALYTLQPVSSFPATGFKQGSRARVASVSVAMVPFT